MPICCSCFLVFLAGSPQFSQGQGTHEFPFVAFVDMDETIRLAQAGRDLRHISVYARSDRYSQACRVENSSLYEGGRFVRIAPEAVRPRHIEHRFIDGNLHDIGRELGEYFHYLTRQFRISPHPHWEINPLRASFKGFGNRHGRMQAKGSGFVGTGGNDAAMAGRSADDHRFSLKFGIVVLLDRCEKGVKIDMEINMLHRVSCNGSHAISQCCITESHNAVRA